MFKKYILLIFIICCLFGCTEPYLLNSLEYEDILVAEGMLTDSLQYQAIVLSRTTPVNSSEMIFENNAEVWVESDTGEIITYSQSGSNTSYISEIPYRAEHGKSYTLHIKTATGKEYVSSKEETPQAFDFEQAFAKAENYENMDGARVYATISGTTNEPVYMRFEYEEVYKIVTYYNIVYDVTLTNIVRNISTCHVDYTINTDARTEESTVCYSDNYFSTNIILGNSNQLVSNRNNNFPVNFIPATDYRIRDRYSILIKAYSENYTAYKYYYDTKQNAAQESELTPRQPGYIRGNITSLQNENEKVFGLFHIATVGRKRIFFDYSDLGFNKPEYFTDCETIKYNYYGVGPGCDDPGDRYYLFSDIYDYNYQLLGIGPDMSPVLWEFTIAKPECSDCRTFASNVAPDFWEN